MNGSIFEKNVAVFAKKRQLFCGCGRVLLAVSGGADSVVLCSAIVKLAAGSLLTGPATASLLPEPANDAASGVESVTGIEPVSEVESVTRTGVEPATGVEFVIGHVNHNLRGSASDGDEEFVVRLAEMLGLTVLTRSVATRDYAAGRKVSIETAARQLRRDALIDMAAESKCDAIATAHHKDDNAETVIHRLMRGTGIRGLGGIWPKRTLSGGSGRMLSGGGRTLCGAGGEVRFIRPLLCVSRAEIVEYCKGKQLNWRTDHTNDDVSFTRNRIRQLLLPHLQQASEGKLCDQLAELSQVSRKLYGKIALEVDELWERAAVTVGADEIVLDPAVLTGHFKAVWVELVRRALTQIGSGERNLSRQHYQRIIQLAEGPAGRTVQLPGGFIAVSDYGRIILSKAQGTGKGSGAGKDSGDGKGAVAGKDSEAGKGAPAGKDSDAGKGAGAGKGSGTFSESGREVVLPIPGEAVFEGVKIEATVLEAEEFDIEDFKAQKDGWVECLDLDCVSGEVTVRRPRAGDKFWPIGLKGPKKVGKFVTAQRVSRSKRDRLMVIADKEKILWLAPLRASEETKITERTQRIVRLRVGPTCHMGQESVRR